jgi:putative membrane protein
MMTRWDMTGWGLILMSLVGVLLLVLLFLTRARGSTPGPQQEGRQDAEQILAQRMARGEIDVHEYQRRRDVLRSTDLSIAPEQGIDQQPQGHHNGA